MPRFLLSRWYSSLVYSSYVLRTVPVGWLVSGGYLLMHVVACIYVRVETWKKFLTAARGGCVSPSANNDIIMILWLDWTFWWFRYSPCLSSTQNNECESGSGGSMKVEVVEVWTRRGFAKPLVWFLSCSLSITLLFISTILWIELCYQLNNISVECSLEYWSWTRYFGS